MHMYTQMIANFLYPVALVFSLFHTYTYIRNMYNTERINSMSPHNTSMKHFSRLLSVATHTCPPFSFYPISYFLSFLDLNNDDGNSKATNTWWRAGEETGTYLAGLFYKGIGSTYIQPLACMMTQIAYYLPVGWWYLEPQCLLMFHQENYFCPTLNKDLCL